MRAPKRASRRRSDPPRVLLALDSFGGFMAADELGRRAVARLRQHGLQAVNHPLSDGGEGLLDCLRAHAPLRIQRVQVEGALGSPRLAELGWRGQRAIVETAEAVGMRWLSRRQPLDASSAGVAALLQAAAGADELWIGLGGSATVDGGLGMLRALGVRALDDAARNLDGPPARVLQRVQRLEGEPSALPAAVVLADVQTALGQSVSLFGPQKGLEGRELAKLQVAFRRWSGVLVAWARSRGLALDPALPGGGAAGGLGLALAALGAPLVPGATRVADETGLDQALDQVQVVVVGEGRLDPASLQGKVVGEVLGRARARGLPVVGLVGQLQPGFAHGLDHVVELGGQTSAALVDAVDRLAAWLRSPAPG